MGWLPMAVAQPATPVAHFFGSLERTVVASGAPVVMEVEGYLLVTSPDDVAAMTAAFEQATLDGPADGITVVRREDRPVRRMTLVDGPEVAVFSTRFILRTERTGRLDVPPFAVRFGGRVYRVMVPALQVYELDPGFFSVRQAVVPVQVQARDATTGRRLHRIGTAFLAAPDALVTGYHVVMDAERVEVTLPDGRTQRLDRAWAVDPIRDVVVLYVNPKLTRAANMQPLSMAPLPPDPARTPSEEEVVFTYGWPGGFQRSTAGLQYDGVVLTEVERLWVSANPVRPGDSGGPLLDRRGEVLGIVTAGTVLSGHRDVLREEVCIASDPRPALRQRLLGSRPRLLEDFFADPALRALPHVQALQLSNALFIGRRAGSDVRARLARFEEAVARWQAPDPGLHFMEGAIHQLLGTADEAVAAYEAALDVYDDYFPATYMLARHHLDTGDYRRAERLFRRTRQHPPYARLAAFGEAQALIRQLRYEEAIPLLEEVLRYDPAFGPALYDLARCRLALGQLPEVWVLQARLFDVNPRWARRLRQMLHIPALQPVRLLEWPRVPLWAYLPHLP